MAFGFAFGRWNEWGWNGLEGEMWVADAQVVDVGRAEEDLR